MHETDEVFIRRTFLQYLNIDIKSH